MTPSQEQSFTAFVQAHGDELMRHARLLFADAGEAEDALQTALLRLARHWHREFEAPAAYAKTVLRNLARDGARRRHRVATPSPAEPELPPEPDLADAYAAADRLDRLLGALPPRQRLAVVLRVVEGRSEAETAAAMGCSTGTVKSTVARALARLRAALDAGRPVERSS